MTPLELTVVLFLIAIGAGAIGSLVGLGGGVVIIPALTLGFHVGIREAIGASIVAVVATSVAAAPRMLDSGHSNVRLGVFLALATTTGAVTGALVSGLVDARVLYGLFAAVLVVSGVQMLRHRHGGPSSDVDGDGAGARAVGSEGRASVVSSSLGLHGRYREPAVGQVDYAVHRPLLGLSLMYVAGTMSGMLGIGSGALKVPAMDVAMKLPMKVSTATSNLLIGMTASAGALVYLLRGEVDPYLAAPVALGVLLGASVAGRAFGRLEASSMRWFFLAVLVGVTVEMALKAVGV